MLLLLFRLQSTHDTDQCCATWFDFSLAVCLTLDRYLCVFVFFSLTLILKLSRFLFAQKHVDQFGLVVGRGEKRKINIKQCEINRPGQIMKSYFVPLFRIARNFVKIK